MEGFYLKELRVTGNTVEPRKVIFDKGLNVINGPSNTGKSYVLQCIDYIFGAKKIKTIEQAEGYDTISLEIKRYSDDTPITLVREINGSKIYYSYSTVDEFEKSSERELNSKHNAEKENNISKFLLNLIGITENKRLISNQNGKKKALGFRGISNLTIVDEDKISSEESSPVLDKETTNNTYSKSLFRYLLTQKDDSECEEIEIKDIRMAKIQAKLDYITDEVIKLEEKKKVILARQPVEDEEGIENTIKEYRKQVIELEECLNGKRQELASAVKHRDILSTKNTKITVLLNRLRLLKRQYESDISRLQFVQEGEECFAQIEINDCPLCKGKISESESLEEREKIIHACNKEVNRINIHLKELVETLEATSFEKEEVTSELEQQNNIVDKPKRKKLLVN